MSNSSGGEGFGAEEEQVEPVVEHLSRGGTLYCQADCVGLRLDVPLYSAHKVEL